jgi:uncharacterized glyoxalase superfamily protein PhnB
MTAETTVATLYPNLLYADADEAMSWLERTLGFQRMEEHRDDAGAVQHAELRLGQAIVMLGTAGTGREPFRGLPGGGCLVYCAVDDIDSLYQRARDAGAEIALELTDTDYGSRDFTVRDPEGNLWALGTYRPTVGDVVR